MKNNSISKIAVKFALLTMIVAGAGVSLLAWLSYKEAEKIFKEHSQERMEREVDTYAKTVLKSLGALKYDLAMLTMNDTVEGYLRAISDKFGYDEKSNKTVEQYRKETIKLFSVMAQQNSAYVQIRLLNSSNGDELVRVDRKNDRVTVTPISQLQNKAHRDYFIETLKLPTNEIYISSINLNREHHTIETPYRPVLRVAKQLRFNDNNGLMVIINVDVRKLFNFDSFKKEKGVVTYVANSEGYYLCNMVEPYKEFGFEFGLPYTIYSDFPKTKELLNGGVDRLHWNNPEEDMIYEAARVHLTDDIELIILKEAKSILVKERSKEYVAKLMLYVGLTAFFIVILTALAVMKITRPISKLSRAAKEIAKSGGSKRLQMDIHTGDEIEELARSFEAMLDALIKSKEEIEQFAERLEEEVAKKTEDLQLLNEELEKKVKAGVQEIRKKDQVLMQQAKLADMGEMIGAIAHQWRQPLNALALNIQLIEELVEHGELSTDEASKLVKKSMDAIQFMSKTIDDFRNFYREDKQKQIFRVDEAVENTLNLQKAQLEARDIDLETELEPVEIEGYKNDFMQVILNLVSNARDALLDRKKIDEDFKGKIYIRVKKEGDDVVVQVEDNGGGISEEIRDKIFNPYFTTKEEGKGTGLGLNMSKRIVEEKFGGILSVENGPKGAIFTIRFKGKQ